MGFLDIGNNRFVAGLMGGQIFKMFSPESLCCLLLAPSLLCDEIFLGHLDLIPLPLVKAGVLLLAVKRGAVFYYYIHAHCKQDLGVAPSLDIKCLGGGGFTGKEHD